MTAHRPSRRLVLLVVAVALVAAACGDDDAPAAATATTAAAPQTTTTPVTATLAEVPLESTRPAADYAGFRAQETACGGTRPPASIPLTFEAPGDMGLDPGTMLQATITTSCGDITVSLEPGIAPATVNSFVFLAEQGYFDGTVSHRIVPGFVLQAGDPTATGLGNPGYVLPDELPPDDFVYATGVLAMANAGPGTSGSQFFIMLSDNPLPPQFSVFGRVLDGDATLDRIAAIPLGSLGREASIPLETLYIESVTIGTTVADATYP